MILIGTMNLTRTRDRGNFYCPTCRTPQSYRLRTRRPFLTIYFIPTVPIGSAEAFVQCDGCRSTWDLSVLEMDQKGHERVQEEQFREEALRACVLIVLADGHVSEQEIAALLQIASGLLETPTDRETLGRLSSIAAENRVKATNYVLTISRRWSQPQKRKALQAMFLAASATGELGTEQLAILTQMKELLELTDPQYESAIEEALTYE
ncbi:tellurite resistance TerB family protein [Novipirellula artificiosorum]|uniref:Tellurite resistance protein TerB n=1 Tax=Novipirellula artificiosorum TaxID=2528016 RepID=A0A5C6DA40_9BACT|nr:TerB family tellurite resistance protein [Novipirellula artificiosorum]TWU32995.1 Tellurite resistance protein TerB [Novipirellula artificiosorum]